MFIFLLHLFPLRNCLLKQGLCQSCIPLGKWRQQNASLNFAALLSGKVHNSYHQKVRYNLMPKSVKYAWPAKNCRALVLFGGPKNNSASRKLGITPLTDPPIWIASSAHHPFERGGIGISVVLGNIFFPPRVGGISARMPQGFLVANVILRPKTCEENDVT